MPVKRQMIVRRQCSDYYGQCCLGGARPACCVEGTCECSKDMEPRCRPIVRYNRADTARQSTPRGTYSTVIIHNRSIVTPREDVTRVPL